jgi:hypothetical protein
MGIRQRPRLLQIAEVTQDSLALELLCPARLAGST